MEYLSNKRMDGQQSRAQDGTPTKSNPTQKSKINLENCKLLFRYFVDDPERSMAGTTNLFYLDLKSGKLYADSRHEDACSFHGNWRNPLRETTWENALAMAKEYCPDQLGQIRRTYAEQYVDSLLLKTDVTKERIDIFILDKGDWSRYFDRIVLRKNGEQWTLHRSGWSPERRYEETEAVDMSGTTLRDYLVEYVLQNDTLNWEDA